MATKDTKQEESKEEVDPFLGHAKLRVVSANKEYVQESNGDMIDVTVQIYYDEANEDGSDEVLSEKRFTYKLGTTTDAIREDLKNVLAVYNSEAITQAKNAKFEALQQAANKTIEDLNDLVIDTDEESSDTEKEGSK